MDRISLGIHYLCLLDYTIDCLCGSVMPYESETWPVNEDVIRLEGNGARMIRWLCNIIPEDSSPGELRNRLQLNNIK